jgi:hypothetical protein
MKSAIELTVFTKIDGPLTKRISIAPDGSIISDGSACVMSRGTAQRAKVADVTQLAKLIEETGSDQALGLGALRADLHDQVRVVRKAQINSNTPHDTIARTADNILYRSGEPAFALLDFDTKGMPPHVSAEITRRGGLWPALTSVMPSLAHIARVTRSSTSAGLIRSDTGQVIPRSGGLHIYLSVLNGADVKRFLNLLHDRCWLAGLGWFIVGAGGQLLNRSLIDRSVFGAERLVFEGNPILEPPLQQDLVKRRPVVTEGKVLDTAADCPALSVVEKAKLNDLRTRAKYALNADVQRARSQFIAAKAARIAERAGISLRAAERVAARHCQGILLPTVELPFDDKDLAGCTVADVLADPGRFDGATLADPLEGVSYGTCKAQIFLETDGRPWIHSFAHGRTLYELKDDAASVRAAMDEAADSEVIKVLVELAADADLDERDLEELRNEAAGRTRITKRTISSMLKAALREREGVRAEQQRARRRAQRTDPRPMLLVPDSDAPWLPTMGTLNGVLGVLPTTRPPLRNIDGYCTRARQMQVPGTHAFTDSNPAEETNSHD